MTTKVTLVAWGERGPGRFIFVAVPDERGRYVRTDRSVAYVACPQCLAMVGEPCKRDTGRYAGVTHHRRRTAATDHLRRERRQHEVPDDMIEPAPEITSRTWDEQAAARRQAGPPPPGPSKPRITVQVGDGDLQLIEPRPVR